MAISHAVRTDRHADRPQREHTGMIGTSKGIWGWSRVTLVGIALVLTGAETALADMIRPNMESGGSGAEATTLVQSDASSEVWTYELPYEQGRPVLVTQATNDVWLANAAYQNQRSILLLEGKEAPVEVVDTTTGGGNYTVVGEDGNAFSAELVSSGSPDPKLMCVACAILE